LTNTYSKTRILVECAVLVAMSYVLVLIPLFKLPNGGSVTLASMVPIVIISLRHGSKWGLLSGVVFCIIQMMTGFYPPPTPTILYFTAVVFLDYVVAFVSLGTAGSFSAMIGGGPKGAAFGAFCVTTICFLGHFFSGILIWGVYAPEGQPVWLYSLIYNGSYMLPEIIITTVVTFFIIRFLPMPKKA